MSLRMPDPSLRCNDIIELDITDIAFGGNGVGRCDGCVVFVPFTITGERVRARLMRRKKRSYLADLVEVVTPSPHRTVPFCRYFTSCGGCQYQHVAYDVQLQLKTKQLVDILERIGGFVDPLPIAPMLPSPRTAHYRNRIDLHPRADGLYGFCSLGTVRGFFPLKSCALFELERDWSTISLHKPDCLLVVRTHDGRPYCYFKDDRNNVQSGPYDLETLQPIADHDIRFAIGAREYSGHYGGFFQVNRWILPAFVETVVAMADPQPGDTLLDVYCGTGLFGLALAHRVARVLGIEMNDDCIEYARRNAAALGITSATFTAAPAEKYLAQLVLEGERVDVCILDPPRNGMANKAVSALKKLRPPVIVYVSCGPDTFARDARKLVNAGYAITALQPLDLFPNTKHFELVAKFVRTTTNPPDQTDPSDQSDQSDDPPFPSDDSEI